MNEILIPIAPSELIDKLTLLRVKAENMSDLDSLARAHREQEMLEAIANDAFTPSQELTRLWADLYRVNTDLWVIEHDLRKCEARDDFGPAFIALARAIHMVSDERQQIKNQIDMLLGFDLGSELNRSMNGS